MITDNDLKEIKPKQSSTSATAEHVQNGIPIAKGVRVSTFSPGEWEDFVEEWATSLQTSYLKVRRFGGAGDWGVDIAGFCTVHGLQGLWDNYQCKQYNQPLKPSDVWVEIGKVIYYSYLKKYTPPRKHYFLCPKGTGTSLEQLLNDSAKLKIKVSENWNQHCQKGITTTADIMLSGDLGNYFNAFDFSIFASKSTAELILGHGTTIFHAVRFGGGLPPRPNRLVKNSPHLAQPRLAG